MTETRTVPGPKLAEAYDKVSGMPGPECLFTEAMVDSLMAAAAEDYTTARSEALAEGERRGLETLRPEIERLGRLTDLWLRVCGEAQDKQWEDIDKGLRSGEHMSPDGWQAYMDQSINNTAVAVVAAFRRALIPQPTGNDAALTGDG